MAVAAATQTVAGKRMLCALACDQRQGVASDSAAQLLVSACSAMLACLLPCLSILQPLAALTLTMLLLLLCYPPTLSRGYDDRDRGYRGRSRSRSMERRERRRR